MQRMCSKSETLLLSEKNWILTKEIQDMPLWT